MIHTVRLLRARAVLAQQEAADARLLAAREPRHALRVQLLLRLVIVHHVRLGRVHGHVVVVVEVAAEARVPREGPAHAAFEGLDLVDGRAAHGREGGVARVEVGEVAQVVCEQWV